RLEVGLNRAEGQGRRLEFAVRECRRHGFTRLARKSLRRSQSTLRRNCFYLKCNLLLLCVLRVLRGEKLGQSPRRKSPDRPPDFDSRRICSTVIPRSTAFAMSYTVRAAM